MMSHFAKTVAVFLLGFSTAAFAKGSLEIRQDLKIISEQVAHIDRSTPAKEQAGMMAVLPALKQIYNDVKNLDMTLEGCFEFHSVPSESCEANQTKSLSEIQGAIDIIQQKNPYAFTILDMELVNLDIELAAIQHGA